MTDTQPPALLSARFTLELEFVLCLANPHYLSYLAGQFPHLLNRPADTTWDDDTDAAKFARYLKYLYGYWKQPKYSQYLTHPAVVLGNLKRLQQEQFRKDVIKPEVTEKLLHTNVVLAEPHTMIEAPAEGMDIAAG